MEMSGNRHPFRVGPVREAYWGTLGPIITSALWAGPERRALERVGRQSDRVHTHQPHCGFIILACDLSQLPPVSTQPTVCVCARCWESITSLRYRSPENSFTADMRVSC